MILSDRDIEQAMDADGLEISPITDYELQLQPASFDLYLSNEFRKLKPGAVLDMDEGIPDEDTIEITSDAYVLEPGEFILGSTVEYVNIPNGLVAEVEGRSSVGRMAVDVHATAGYIDPGFEGQITLEISNKNQDNAVVLRPNRKFCQLVFKPTKSKSRNAYGSKADTKYQSQTGPTGTRINRDEELDK
jgi:dCTP deaminase